MVEEGREEGFTLLEVMVVSVVIAILITVLVPTALAQRQRAYDADAKTAARSAAQAMITYLADTNTTATGDVRAQLIALEPTLARANFPFGNIWPNGGASGSVNQPSWEVDIVSKTGTTFSFISNYGGGWTAPLQTRRICSAPGTGSCPSPAVVNGWGAW